MSNLLNANNMRTGLTRSSIFFSGLFEFAGGIATGLLGIFIYMYMVLKDASLGASIQRQADLLGILMLVVPGVLVAVGSYLQAILRKNWALILVLIAGSCNLIFVGINAGFAFAYAQDAWGQWAVRAGLAVTLLTLTAACINALISMVAQNRL